MFNAFKSSISMSLSVSPPPSNRTWKKTTRGISFQSKEEQKSKLWQYKAK